LRLRYSAAALRQIADTLAYVAARSPQGAISLQARIAKAVALIEDHPHAAQGTSRANARRVALTPYPYVIFYVVASDGVIVTRFRHTSRRPTEKLG
jgi:plasmid stabilization system protein ParE